MHSGQFSFPASRHIGVFSISFLFSVVLASLDKRRPAHLIRAARIEMVACPLQLERYRSSRTAGVEREKELHKKKDQFAADLARPRGQKPSHIPRTNQDNRHRTLTDWACQPLWPGRPPPPSKRRCGQNQLEAAASGTAPIDN